MTMRINSKKYKNQFDLDAILRHTKEQKYASSLLALDPSTGVHREDC
jgi:glucose dehydrogenase